MKIKRFFEQEENLKISDDTVKDILEKLVNITTTLDNNKKSITSITNTLSNFKSKSKTSNTRIDDSYLNLESVDNKLSDILTILDTVVTTLKEYKPGEESLY